MIKERKKIGQGFTLVELLVVIAIMAILTVITVSQFTMARKRSRDVQRKGDLNSFSKALQMYYADYGVFPTKDVVDDVWGGEFTDRGYTYMKVVPQESYLTSYPFCYVVDTDLKEFNLFTQLENTNDDECNMATSTRGAYSCDGQYYCYGVASPNSSVGGI